jgi:small subunit ribosomal protein S21
MLIIPLKEGENIERALKKYKKKYERTGMLKELRSRQNFTKPSVENRQMRLKAAYIEQLKRSEM